MEPRARACHKSLTVSIITVPSDGWRYAKYLVLINNLLMHAITGKALKKAVRAPKVQVPFMALGVPMLMMGAMGAVSSPAQAFTVIAQPTASYISSTQLIDISSIAEGEYPISSITDGIQTVGFSSDVEKRTVGVTWTTWGSPPATESSTPSVLYSDSASQLLTLSLPSAIFGFELEPADVTDVFSYTANFYSGTSLVGSITQSVDGNAGAILFAASDNSPFTSVNISGGDTTGFAMAQFRYAVQQPQQQVPGPLPILGVVAAFVYSRKLRRRIKESKALPVASAIG